MAKKAKARTIIVKLLSTAGTGFFYTTRRPRTTAKLSFMKFDPRGMLWFFALWALFDTAFDKTQVSLLIPIIFQLFHNTKQHKTDNQNVLFNEAKINRPN